MLWGRDYYFLLGNFLLVMFVLVFTWKCKKIRKELDSDPQVAEAMTLSLFTVTNLNKTRAAKFFRKLSTYLVFILYTLYLGFIAILPKAFKELYDDSPDLLEKLARMEPFIYGTVAAGFLSLFLDWSFRWQPIFHRGKPSNESAGEDGSHDINSNVMADKADSPESLAEAVGGHIVDVHEEGARARPYQHALKAISTRSPACVGGRETNAGFEDDIVYVAYDGKRYYDVHF